MAKTKKEAVEPTTPTVDEKKKAIDAKLSTSGKAGLVTFSGSEAQFAREGFDDGSGVIVQESALNDIHPKTEIYSLDMSADIYHGRFQSGMVKNYLWGLMKKLMDKTYSLPTNDDIRGGDISLPAEHDLYIGMGSDEAVENMIADLASTLMTSASSLGQNPVETLAQLAENAQFDKVTGRLKIKDELIEEGSEISEFVISVARKKIVDHVEGLDLSSYDDKEAKTIKEKLLKNAETDSWIMNHILSHIIKELTDIDRRPKIGSGVSGAKLRAIGSFIKDQVKELVKGSSYGLSLDDFTLDQAKERYDSWTNASKVRTESADDLTNWLPNIIEFLSTTESWKNIFAFYMIHNYSVSPKHPVSGLSYYMLGQPQIKLFGEEDAVFTIEKAEKSSLRITVEDKLALAKVTAQESWAIGELLTASLVSGTSFYDYYHQLKDTTERSDIEEWITRNRAIASFVHRKINFSYMTNKFDNFEQFHKYHLAVTTIDAIASGDLIAPPEDISAYINTRNANPSHINLASNLLKMITTVLQKGFDTANEFAALSKTFKNKIGVTTTDGVLEPSQSEYGLNKKMLMALETELARQGERSRFIDRYNELQGRIKEGFSMAMGAFRSQSPDVNDWAMRHHSVMVYSPFIDPHEIAIDASYLSPATLLAYAKAHKDDPSRFFPEPNMSGDRYGFVCAQGSKDTIATFARATGIGRVDRGKIPFLASLYEVDDDDNRNLILKDGSFDEYLPSSLSVGDVARVLTEKEFSDIGSGLSKYIQNRHLYDYIPTPTVSDTLAVLGISDSISAVETNWGLLFKKFFSVKGTGKNKKYTSKHGFLIKLKFDISSVIQVNFPSAIIKESAEFVVIDRQKAMAANVVVTSNVLQVPEIKKIVVRV